MKILAALLAGCGTNKTLRWQAMKTLVCLIMAAFMAGCASTRELEPGNHTEVTKLQEQASEGDIQCFQTILAHEAQRASIMTAPTCEHATTAAGESECYQAQQTFSHNALMFLTVDMYANEAPICEGSQVARYYYQYKVQRAKAIASGVKSFMTFAAWAYGIDAVRDIAVAGAAYAGNRSESTSVNQNITANEGSSVETNTAINESAVYKDSPPTDNSLDQKGKFQSCEGENCTIGDNDDFSAI